MSPQQHLRQHVTTAESAGCMDVGVRSSAGLGSSPLARCLPGRTGIWPVEKTRCRRPTGS